MTASAWAARPSTDTRTGRLWVLGALCAAVFLLFLDTTVVNVALSRIGADLAGGLGGLQWVVDAYTLAVAAALLPAGAAADRWGATTVLVAGIGLFALACVGCASAHGVTGLAVWRGVQGLGAATVLPSGLSLIAGMYPDERRRAHVIAGWSAVSGLALAVGPAVGALLVAWQGWRAVFWVGVGPALLVGAALALCAPRPGSSSAVRAATGVTGIGTAGGTAPGAGHRTATGAGIRTAAQPAPVALVATSLAAAAAVTGCLEGPRWGPADPRTLAAVALAGAAVAVLARATRAGRGVLPPGLLRHPDVVVALLAGFTAFFALYAVVFVVPLLDQRAFGLDVRATGLAALPLTVAIVAAGPFTGRRPRRLRESGPVLAGLVALTAGLLVVVAAGLDPHSPWRAAGMVALGAGSTFALTPATAALVRVCGPASAGATAGLSNVVRNVGAAVAVAFVGPLLGRATPAPTPGDGREALLATAAVAALATAAAATLALRARAPARAAVPDDVPDASAPAPSAPAPLPTRSPA